ncbi:MAG: hypothetical protein M3N31_08125 [Actinomycetota bacterium]|nr:hypothetical protein [Actinomycetota bacterium]
MSPRRSQELAVRVRRPGTKRHQEGVRRERAAGRLHPQAHGVHAGDVGPEEADAVALERGP